MIAINMSASRWVWKTEAERLKRRSAFDKIRSQGGDLRADFPDALTQQYQCLDDETPFGYADRGLDEFLEIMRIFEQIFRDEVDSLEEQMHSPDAPVEKNQQRWRA